MASKWPILINIARSGIFAQHPMFLSLFVTQACTARCRMCLWWKEVYGPAKERATQLTLDQINTLTQSMGRLLQVHICGGEPFLRPDLTEILHICGQNCSPNIVILPTNGSLSDRLSDPVTAFCKRFPDTELRLNLSIDAVGEAHDAIRRHPGIYEKALASTAILKSLQPSLPNLSINITTVLSGFNRNGIESAISRIIADFQPDSYAIMLARGDMPTQEEPEASMSEYRRALEDVWQKMRHRRTRQSMGFWGEVLQRLVARAAEQSEEERRQAIPCGGGTKHIMVKNDGAVIPCDVLQPFLDQHGITELPGAELANLHEYDFDVPKALASPRAQEVIEFIKAGKCYCTSDCALIPTLLLTPSLYPKVAAEAAKLAVGRLGEGHPKGQAE